MTRMIMESTVLYGWREGGCGQGMNHTWSAF